MMQQENSYFQSLIESWKRIFGHDYQVPDTFTGLDTDLFDAYLAECIKGKSFEYTSKVLVLNKDKEFLGLFFDGNKIETAAITRRTLPRLVSKAEIIITNFLVDTSTLKSYIHKGKVVLRKEVVLNYLAAGVPHFIAKTLQFPSSRLDVFLTSRFYKLLTKNSDWMSYIMYVSFLMNYLENGCSIRNVGYKPEINISKYGRWYFKDRYNLQNDKEKRSAVLSRAFKDGRFLTIDFISAGPMEFAALCKSRAIKSLVNYRVKNYEAEDSDTLKRFLNVLTFSNNDPSSVASMLKHEGLQVPNIITKDILNVIRSDIVCYNNIVVDNYRKKLVVPEGLRRCIDIRGGADSDGDVAKRHRVYIQGHVHDTLLMISREIFHELEILPLYTIHDELTYFLRSGMADSAENKIESVVRSFKRPYRIEITPRP